MIRIIIQILKKDIQDINETPGDNLDVWEEIDDEVL